MSEQLGLPQFPTQWGEEEEKRLRDLQQQKSRMDELWTSKFYPEAWQQTPPVERGFRGLIHDTHFESVMRVLSPWRWGYDYGVTPESARERMITTEGEYNELIRQQSVVESLPLVMDTLRALALIGKPVFEKGDFNKFFKLGELGYTDEEESYIIAFSKSLLMASEEDLISGDPWGIGTITPEMIDELTRGDSKVLNPEYILSTVAFSQNTEEIRQALRWAYPGEEAAGGLNPKDRILTDYNELLRQLGVTQLEGESLEDAAKRAMETYAANSRYITPFGADGKPLLDPATGEAIRYNLDTENHAWHQGQIIGRYDEETDRLIPITPAGNDVGSPEAEQEKRGVIRKALDLLSYAALANPYSIPYVGTYWALTESDLPMKETLEGWKHALELKMPATWYMVRQWSLNTLPYAILSQLPGASRPEDDSTINRVTRILNFNPWREWSEHILGVADTRQKLLQLQEHEEARAEASETLSTIYDRLAFLDELSEAPPEQRISLLNERWAMHQRELATLGLPPVPELTDKDKTNIAVINQIEGIQGYIKEQSFKREEQYYTWLADIIKERPELMPPTEWEEPMVERLTRNVSDLRQGQLTPKQALGDLLDPGYIGYNFIQGLDTYFAAAASIGVTYATGSPQFGMMTAMAMFLPLETESLRMDLMQSGASYEQATLLAAPAGAIICSIESLGNAPLQRAFAPQFFKVAKRHALQALVSAFFKIGLSEITEEVIQEITHNAFVKTYDENRHLLENVAEVVLQSTLNIGPLAMIGGGTEYINMKRMLPALAVQQLEADSKALQDAGMPKEQADLIAFNSLYSTPEGKAAIDSAVDQINAQMPETADGINAKLTDLNDQLDMFNRDITDLQEKLKDREARQAKDELMSRSAADMQLHRDVIEYLQNTIKDLEIQRGKMLDNIQAAQEIQSDLETRNEAESVFESVTFTDYGTFNAREWLTGAGVFTQTELDTRESFVQQLQRDITGVEDVTVATDLSVSDTTYLATEAGGHVLAGVQDLGKYAKTETQQEVLLRLTILHSIGHETTTFAGTQDNATREANAWEYAYKLIEDYKVGYRDAVRTGDVYMKQTYPETEYRELRTELEKRLVMPPTVLAESILDSINRGATVDALAEQSPDVPRAIIEQIRALWEQALSRQHITGLYSLEARNAWIMQELDMSWYVAQSNNFAEWESGTFFGEGQVEVSMEEGVVQPTAPAVEPTAVLEKYKTLERGLRIGEADEVWAILKSRVDNLVGQVDATPEQFTKNKDGSITLHGYHGTYTGGIPTKVIGEWKELGFHAGTLEAAREHLYGYSSIIKFNKNPKNIAKYENPTLHQVDITLRNPYGSLENPVSESVFADNANRAKLMNEGYDGIIYKNIVEDVDSISVVSFGLENVKTIKTYNLTAGVTTPTAEPAAAAGGVTAPVVRDTTAVTYWNEKLEKNALRTMKAERTDGAAFIALQLEYAGDILREMGKQSPDMGYIKEKARKIRKGMQGEEWNYTLSGFEKSRLNAIIKDIEAMPIASATTEAVQGLLLHIANRNQQEVDHALKRVETLVKQDIAKPPVAAEPKVEAPAAVEATADIEAQAQKTVDAIQDALDETRKTESLKKVKKLLATADAEAITGLDGLNEAIQDYEQIERKGLTPEEYAEVKQDAFEEIVNTAEELTVEVEAVVTEAPAVIPSAEGIPVTKKQWQSFWITAKRLGYTVEQVHYKLGVASMKEWTDQGRDLHSAIMLLRGTPLEPAKPAFNESPPVSEELPRTENLATSTLKTEQAVRASPKIQAFIKLNRQLTERQAHAEKMWMRAIQDERDTVARETGLGKTTAAKAWGDMYNYEKAKITLYYTPDGSIHFGMMREIADMEEFCEMLESAVGLPFYQAYRRAMDGKSLGDYRAELITKEVSQDHRFKAALKDPASLQIIEQELNARNEIQGVAHPENITADQMAVVDKIQEIYDRYKSVARYLSFLRAKTNMDSLKSRFPDAVRDGKVHELEQALALRQAGNMEALYAYLSECTWGVIQQGFDPRQIAHADMQVHEVAMGDVRGAGSLEQRTVIEFPEGKLRRNVITRMIAYVTQMEIQLQVEQELHHFDDLWKSAYPKLSNRDEVRNGINRWWKVMQGIPSQYGHFERHVTRRIWRQGVTAIFLEPALALRNSFQSLVLHYDRAELTRMLVDPPSPAIKEIGRRYFDIHVSQLAGLRKDWLHVGQPGLPGLGWLNMLADRANLYGYSDYYPRMWSFMAYLNKAERATNQYLKDGDVGKWIRNSGAIHLRQAEINFVLSEYLSRANEIFDLKVDGLEHLTGIQMAELYVAHRNTDRTHFKYRREQRGILEMGSTGETLWNLVVFPRGYGQRVAVDLEKMTNLFKGDATWAEARSSFGDLIKLFIAAQIFGAIWTKLTGRKRNPYDPLQILTQWEFGGLAVGIPQDAFRLVSDIATAANPLGDKTEKDRAKGRLAGRVTRLSDSLLPFYKRAIDIWAAVEETDDQDKYWLRQLLAQFDDKYTPADLEQYDMSLWEQLRKGLLGTPPVDYDSYTKMLMQLDESRSMLGKQDPLGRFHTLRHHGSRVETLTKGLPDILMSDYSDAHPLDIFYLNCRDDWAEYYRLSSEPASIRKNWRKNNIEAEAMMLFWGKFSQSIFKANSQEWQEVKALLNIWFDQYGITPLMHPEWSDWRRDLYG